VRVVRALYRAKRIEVSPDKASICVQLYYNRDRGVLMCVKLFV